MLYPFLTVTHPECHFCRNFVVGIFEYKFYVNSCPLFGSPVRVTDVLYVGVQVNIHIRRKMFLVEDGFETQLLSG